MTAGDSRKKAFDQRGVYRDLGKKSGRGVWQGFPRNEGKEERRGKGYCLSWLACGKDCCDVPFSTECRDCRS